MNTPLINSSFPKPTEIDYAHGSFTRYFIRQTNQRDGEILEVNEFNFRQAETSPFYITTSLNWVLVGSDNDILNDFGYVIQKSLIEANKSAARLAERDIPGISKIFTNFTQLRR